MRIALFPGTFLPKIGGVEMATHYLALRLQQRGHFVVVFTWWGMWRQCLGRLPYRVRPLLPRTFAWDKLPRLKGGIRTSMYSTFQFTTYQKLFRFEIWHAHMACPAGFLLSMALPRLRVPYVVTSHGGDTVALPEIRYGCRLNPGLDQAVRQALDHADAIVAISSLMREHISALIKNQERIVDIPNGVDTDIFTPAEERSKLGAGKRGPLEILSVSRGDFSVKNTPFIADIAADLKSRGLPFHWTVIGRENEELERRSRALGLSGEITVRPAIEIAMSGDGLDLSSRQMMLRDLYRRADVVVVPSLFESFSLVALEALACGKPVVVSRNCGCRDLIRSGRNGWLTEPGSIKDFTEGIVKLQALGAEREAPAFIAREAAGPCAWARVTAEHEKLYQRIALERTGQAKA